MGVAQHTPGPWTVTMAPNLHEGRLGGCLNEARALLARIEGH